MEALPVTSSIVPSFHGYLLAMNCLRDPVHWTGTQSGDETIKVQVHVLAPGDGDVATRQACTKGIQLSHIGVKIRRDNNF